MLKQTTEAGVYTDLESLLSLRHLGQGLTLEARKQSQALLEGSVRTRYRGRGMEFAEVRPYQAGDDIRTIDWRVTARMQAPYTKLFQEEHERPVFIMADQRANMFFGSEQCFKSVYAAQLSALIAWIALHNNDRTGALIFGNRYQKDIRARRGKHAVLELLNQLAQFNRTLDTPIKPDEAMDLSTMLQETNRVARPGSLVILISDFHDFDQACVQPLAMLAKRSDLLAVHCYDRLESALPPNNILSVSNERRRLTVNTRDMGQAYAAAFSDHQAYLRRVLTGFGVQYVHAPTHINVQDFAQDLFRAKQGRRARIPTREVQA